MKKTVLITGCSSGPGKAAAKLFAEGRPRKTLPASFSRRQPTERISFVLLQRKTSSPGSQQESSESEYIQFMREQSNTGSTDTKEKQP
jgi:hypothetical protein